jgi:hypothetical protein
VVDDLSSQEIFRRVVDADRSINSYELTIVRATDRAGRKSEVVGRQIRVGNDYYRLFPSAAQSSRERLDYKGREYLRDSPDGLWRAPDDVGRGVMAEVMETGTPADWDETLYSPSYAMDFNRFRNAERLSDEVLAGRAAIRLSISETSEIPGWDLGEVEKHLPPMTPDNRLRFREMLGEQLAKQPDRQTLRRSFWIDAETFALVQVVLEGSSYRAGELVESFIETHTYSRINEAELPGPLPD